MHLNIKNDEAHALAAEIAGLTGQTMTAVVTNALREELARQKRLRGREGIAEKLLELGRQYSSFPDADTRTPDEILGYDENGLPT